MENITLVIIFFWEKTFFRNHIIHNSKLLESSLIWNDYFKFKYSVNKIVLNFVKFREVKYGYVINETYISLNLLILGLYRILRKRLWHYWLFYWFEPRINLRVKKMNVRISLRRLTIQIHIFFFRTFSVALFNIYIIKKVNYFFYKENKLLEKAYNNSVRWINR